MAQGFVKSLNLSETPSEADRGILNNLAGAGIVNDIQLFSGNRNRTSKLLASEYTVDGTKIVVTAVGRVPFSNRTKVTHGTGTTQYEVYQSDALNSFYLKDGNGNAFVPTQDLIRDDAITFNNIANLSATRIEAVRDVGSNVATNNASTTSESGIYNLRTIAENYSIIEEGIGIYYYKKSRIPLTEEDSIFNRPITFSGALRITNDSNIPQSTTSPGLFIKGPTAAVRAFSDVSNPWAEDNPSSPTKLQTTANNASVYDLVLNDPNLVIPASEVVSVSGIDADDYTHKMRVRVKTGAHDDTNSSYETFYLLLTT